MSFQTTFQEVASRGMYGIWVLNGFIFQYLIIVLVLVGALVFNMIQNFQIGSKRFSSKYYDYNVWLELFWTFIPIFILLTISLRSFNLLYFMDSVPYADLTVKVMGHQWYWSFEYPNFNYMGGNI